MFREMEAAGQPEPKYRTVEYMVKATLWQHSMVSVSLKLDPIGGKLDPINADADPISADADPISANADQIQLQITKERVERYLEVFDRVIASKYVGSYNIEKSRNACWKVLLCLLEYKEASRSYISAKTGIYLLF